ncbi:MAG: sugar isomerase domain-containing protein [Breznakia sp.]
MFEYINEIQRLLKVIKQDEETVIDTAQGLMVDCIQGQHALYGFGASHAGILIEELYYRAGGLAVFNPIFAKNLMLDTQPISLTSTLERLEGFGTSIAQKTKISKNDVVLIHSVSGRNCAAIEIALYCKNMGAKSICITNLAYSKSVNSRHSSGLRLFEICDVIIDNHGCIGDSAIPLASIKQKVGPTSTVIGAAIVNQLVVNVAKIIEDHGSIPPIFYSANLDEGDDLNKEVVKEYQDIIKFEF